MKRINDAWQMFLVVALVVAAQFLIAVDATVAETVEEIVARGVRLESGNVAALPGPQMPDGLTPAEQQAALRKAAGKYPLAQFMRKSAVAPFSVEISSVDDAVGKRLGQHVDFRFVAYGDLRTVIDEDLFGELAGTQESRRADDTNPSARALTAGELQARGLTALKTAAREESYVLVDVPILNRVKLRGVGMALREKRDTSIIAALVLDDRFHDDKEFPNTWSPLERDAQGKLSVGSPHPYSGLGGYMKITSLTEPAGALFVECHIAFDEPEAWFNGKNFLRSKLPLVVQDNVRTFRRKLAKGAVADENQ